MTVADYITERLTWPFQWGTHDCVCFAVGWLSLKSGDDLLAPYRPWHDAATARAALERAGGLVQQFNEHLTLIHPNSATDGDVTVIDGTAYLFSGVHIVGPGKTGLVFKSRTEAITAWRK